MNLYPLSGVRANVSITASDSPGMGFSRSEVNNFIRRLAEAMYKQGAGMAFGHDWRDDGVMEPVYGFALQAAGPMPAHGEQGHAALMVNLVPWPDRSALSPEERTRLRDTLLIEEIGLPKELEPLALDGIRAAADPNSELYLYLRARGFTHLRRQLNHISDARVCIGGPEKALGRYPGIVEEALLAVNAGMPLYLASLLGGVAQQLVGALRGESMPEGFANKTKAGMLYHRCPVKEYDPDTASDRTFDPGRVWKTFSDLGMEGLRELNGLEAHENDELLETRVAERVIELILRGLGRLTSRSASPERRTPRCRA